ncbi:MAG: hypothetical protein H6741_03780 [Alphaproteobacteria bacterium]|nr:hypothetical protein [Alphaproteobacteria bacterium]
MDRRALFAGGLLLLQALLPLRYYTGTSDIYDERFAWRMFSPVRMLRCGAKFSAEGEELKLSREVHSAWITLVGRGRFDVTEAVGARICATHPGEEVTLHYVCDQLGGERVTVSQPDHDICPDGRW